MFRIVEMDLPERRRWTAERGSSRISLLVTWLVEGPSHYTRTKQPRESTWIRMSPWLRPKAGL